MSEENVEIVRRMVESFNAGGVESALAYFDHGVVIHPYPDWLEGADELHGHQGARTVTQWWTTGDFSAPRIELIELIDAGDKVAARWQQIAETEGHDVAQESAGVATRFRDGRIGEISFFLSWRAALEAAGLSE